MTTIPHVLLNDGVSIPRLGYGVFLIPADQVVEPMTTAIEEGYRLVDTAAAYQNEAGVGKAIANSEIPREDFFVTTKLWNDAHGYDETMRAFDESMAKLGLDYLDLYLIHFPRPALNRYVDSWRAFERLQADGRVRSIGVSNFGVAELDRLAEECSVVPAINQIELHPLYPQHELRAAHAERGIVTQAWSPIGRDQGLLQHPTAVEIARECDRTPAQIVLRWHLQHDIVVIPKSAKPERIRANIQVFDFALDESQMARLDDLGAEQRCHPVPGTLFDVS
ncbi:aldo/keto reductase [Streptosporangium sp. G11]|uniref:aldo/keto reductase n=1 Tax=Streptosporangium sp. G11 TaxID=3436926 RepID=UPI003EB74CF8